MQFSGLDIDPVIRVQVGEQFRYTTIKKSNNNPFYNEVRATSRCLFSLFLTLHSIPYAH